VNWGGVQKCQCRCANVLLSLALPFYTCHCPQRNVIVVANVLLSLMSSHLWHHPSIIATALKEIPVPLRMSFYLWHHPSVIATALKEMPLSLRTYSYLRYRLLALLLPTCWCDYPCAIRIVFLLSHSIFVIFLLLLILLSYIDIALHSLPIKHRSVGNSALSKGIPCLDCVQIERRILSLTMPSYCTNTHLLGWCCATFTPTGEYPRDGWLTGCAPP
jgi:hypothetical protein